MTELDGIQMSALIHAVEGVQVLPEKPVDLPASARYYARRGWPIFPCSPRGKVPLTKRGFKDASTDLEQIEAWIKVHPAANWATPTGSTEQGGCGYDVIDIDQQLGIETFAALPPEEIPTPTALAFTPGQPSRDRGPGRHHYLLATGDGCATKFLPGCDYRGAGGYVMLPPSLGPDGGVYAWIMRPAGI